MSERGMILALQRLHDDPGFTDMVKTDPESTLGIYDLDETECNTLVGAVKSEDISAIRQMASGVGIDWKADHIGGVGAVDERESSLERGSSTDSNMPNALSGDGYEGVKPMRPAGT